MDDLPNRIEEVIVEIAGGAGRLGVRAVELRVQATAAGRDTPLVAQTEILSAATPERKVIRYRRLGTVEPVVRYQAEMRRDPAMAPGGKECWTFD